MFWRASIACYFCSVSVQRLCAITRDHSQGWFTKKIHHQLLILVLFKCVWISLKDALMNKGMSISIVLFVNDDRTIPLTHGVAGEDVCVFWPVELVYWFSCPLLSAVAAIVLIFVRTSSCQTFEHFSQSRHILKHLSIGIILK